MPFNGLQYNPTDAAHAHDALSSVDGGNKQLNTFYWLKKAIIQSRKDQYFMPLASTIGMPKHFGKEIKVFEYVPLLDDRNINDQGIDANEAVLSTADYSITLDSNTYSFAVEADATAAAAAINAIENVATKSGSSTPWTVTASKVALATATKAEKDALLVYCPNVKVVQGSGNLYGSSKDVGTITGKLPTLREEGGRVNRVGFTRLQRSGTLQKFGFFYEFSKESLDFDSDPELQDHLATELMNGAVQLTEAVLQKDLLASAGTVLFAGAAADESELSGESTATAGTLGLVAYEDLVRLDQILNENRTPKQTKVISGSRLVDTKTIAAGRVMFVGSEIVPTLKAMADTFEDKAFIPVHMYADAGNVLNGEIGTIDAFRIVLVPEMLSWAGVGASVTSNGGYRVTGDKYDVFPMLVVGDDSFTTIGFQTDGKSAKFQVITKMPGTETADRDDPYGETGFSSIKWYYGILVKRPERIAMIKTIAPL